MRRRKDLLALGALALGVGCVPLIVESQYQLSVGVFIAIHAVVTIGLCLLMGYAGQISLGHAAFYGLGAYTSGLLTTKFGVDPWLAMAAAIGLTGAIAYAFGGPILRLRGHYLAMATLAFGIIVYLAFVEFKDFTGGPSGLPGIPRLAIGGFAFDNDAKFFYLAWAAVVAALLVSLNLVNSRVGRAFRAIHGSEVAAETLGVDTARLKLKVFTLSAVYAALAGSLYAHYLTFVSPAPFGFIASVEFVVMAAVGGLASIWGAPFGAAAVTLLTEAIRDLMPRVFAYASGEHEVIAYGLLLILIMIFMPEGLTAGTLRLVRRARGAA
ncbi:MAG: branched-chain amino acid ABC transporter permease [Candidatus Rokubacteria bacterium]|nr:branched-chain amino acid ABC transporter permease [Candidatus Rokubacteria bacterium]